MKTKSKNQILFYTLLFFSSFLSAQSAMDTLIVEDSLKSTFDHFCREGVLDITLNTDFKHLIKEKYDGEYQEGEMSYYSKDSVLVVRNVKLRARGNMRRKICSIPPLKVKMKKEDLKEDGLLPFNSLKLVAPCQRGRAYNGFILREYLAYQLYNILTDYSFKTQLIRLNYDDTAGKVKREPKIGFIIESKDELAARNECQAIEVKKCHPDKLARQQTTLVYLFEFMIANTDWQVESIHNLTLLYASGSTDFIPIPYDFDYSGLVDAPYAVPQVGTPYDEVTKRYYGGACRTKKELQETIEIFNNKKEAIMNYCLNFEYLDIKERTRIVQYLEAFYKIINSTNRIEREFMFRC